MGLDPGLNRSAASLWECVPQSRADLFGQITRDLVDRLNQRGAQCLDRFPSIDTVEQLFGIEQVRGQQLDRFGPDFAGTPGHDALPAERADAPELEWPVKHLQRNDLRAPPDKGCNERHREVDQPVGPEVVLDLPPGLHADHEIGHRVSCCIVAAQKDWPSPDSLRVYLSTFAPNGPRESFLMACRTEVSAMSTS